MRIGLRNPGESFIGAIREGVLTEVENDMLARVGAVASKLMMERTEVAIDTNHFDAMQEGDALVFRSVVTIRFKGFGR